MAEHLICSCNWSFFFWTLIMWSWIDNKSRFGSFILCSRIGSWLTCDLDWLGPMMNDLTIPGPYILMTGWSLIYMRVSMLGTWFVCVSSVWIIPEICWWENLPSKSWRFSHRNAWTLLHSFAFLDCNEFLFLAVSNVFAFLEFHLFCHGILVNAKTIATKTARNQGTESLKEPKTGGQENLNNSRTTTYGYFGKAWLLQLDHPVDWSYQPAFQRFCFHQPTQSTQLNHVIIVL